MRYTVHLQYDVENSVRGYMDNVGKTSIAMSLHLQSMCFALSHTHTQHIPIPTEDKPIRCIHKQSQFHLQDQSGGVMSPKEHYDEDRGP